MMKKSTSTKVSLFVVFVLVSAIFSVNGNVYAQNQSQNETLSQALNVTEVPTNNTTNTTQATVPVEEELLPTTTEGLVTANATVAGPGDEMSAATEEEQPHGHSENATTTTAAAKSTVTRDSQTILLEGQSLPEGSFIHLYDSTPYKIMNGHVAAKVPCNEENATAVNILIGQAPDLAPSELEFVEPLSSPGELCLYHADLVSDDTTTITDIAVQNNSTEDIDFPATSTVVLGVNEIASLGDDHHAE
ncbi:MAG TPA: hypothetical protein VD815_02780 [Candidatus Saccharimonadales bacterium]|nr:hypothetical protein [Candidatus Saccharimonadales bacterium]